MDSENNDYRQLAGVLQQIAHGKTEEEIRKAVRIAEDEKAKIEAERQEAEDEEAGKGCLYIIGLAGIIYLVKLVIGWLS